MADLLPQTCPGAAPPQSAIRPDGPRVTPTRLHGAKGMTAVNSGRKRPSFTPSFNTAGLAVVLRRRHPIDTAHCVERDTGGAIGWQTVRNWLEQRNGIRGDHLLVLVAVYGPQILIAAWPEGWGALPGWLDEAEYVAERDKLQAQVDRLETKRLARLAGEGVR